VVRSSVALDADPFPYSCVPLNLMIPHALLRAGVFLARIAASHVVNASENILLKRPACCRENRAPDTIDDYVQHTDTPDSLLLSAIWNRPPTVVSSSNTGEKFRQGGPKPPCPGRKAGPLARSQGEDCRVEFLGDMVWAMQGRDAEAGAS